MPSVDRTTFTYDVDGHLVGSVEPRGNVPGAQPSDYATTVAYDADGRPVTATDALGRVATTAYDVAGRPVSVTDPAGNVTSTTYDADGRTTKVVNPAGSATTYTYSSAGNLTRVRDPRGRITGYTYDAAGNVLTRTDALGRVTAMTYDVVGNVATTVKPSGTVTTDDATDATITFAYDAAHRVTGVSYSDGTPATTYAYSPAGRPTTIARAGEGLDEAGIAYTYDALGRAVTVTRSGPTDSVASYAYTSAGRTAGVAWSTGVAVAYDYNSVGQLTTATPGGTGQIPAVRLGYDPAGNLATVTRGGLPATVTSYAYDRGGQLSGTTHQAGGAVVADYQVVRDVRGLPVQATTTAPDPVTGDPTASTTLSEFDSSGWLTSACTPVSGTVCTSTSPKTTYTYDKAGVRTRVAVRRPTAHGSATTTTRYTVDAGDQLLTQQVGTVVTSANVWTLDGSIASTTTAGGTRTYDTNLAGEVTAVGLADGSQVAYAYDPAGNRTARTVDGVLDATWVWDDATGLAVRVGQYTGAGVLDTAWLPDPTSGTGAAWAATTTTSSAQWLLADPYANTAAEVPTSGATTATGTRVLDAFGVPTASTGDVGALGFAGQYLDQATGLYDVRARDYDPTTGQFTTTDPITTPVGTPAISGFTYGYNNPLMFTDPTGRTPEHHDGSCNSGICAIWAAEDQATHTGNFTCEAIYAYCYPEYVKLSTEDGLVNLAASVFDTLSFGLTQKARVYLNGQLNGESGDLAIIQPNSQWYQAGPGVALLVTLALPLPKGTAAASSCATADAVEAAEVARAAEVAADAAEAANSDLATVTTHLDSIDALASHPPNAAMVSGIEDAIASGRPLTAAEQNFMTHELTEARAVASGASQDAAHAAALETHPTFMNYSPEVIQTLPEYFNSNWRNAWGIE